MQFDSNDNKQYVPLSIPEIKGNEWKYIKECLDSGWVSSVGSYVNKFEELLANYIGAEEAVATTSGTSALHLALLVSGVAPDDEVLVSNLSFIAPANAIRYVGAWPVFIDAEPKYWQMDPDKILGFLEEYCSWQNGNLINKITRRKVSALLPVHILGHPCDMDPIIEIALRFDLKVIEDASESLGALYNGDYAGHLGHIGCFSFNGNKLITTGGGGMIVTDNIEWARKARYLSTQAKDDPVEYLHNEIGYNYRLTNIQAALGVAQMEQIQEFIQRKRDIAQTYDANLREVPGLTLMSTQPGVEATYWLYTVLLGEHATLNVRKQVIDRMNAQGIGVRPLWHTLHNLPPYRDCMAYQIDHSISLYERAISLPSSVGISKSEQERCISILMDVCLEVGV